MSRTVYEPDELQAFALDRIADALERVADSLERREEKERAAEEEAERQRAVYRKPIGDPREVTWDNT